MQKQPRIFICIYFLIRLLLMPIEHTGDGWGYACEILKGDLFAPHHILHKPFMMFMLQCTEFLHVQIEPISLFSSINLFFSTLCLYVFYLILNHFSRYDQLNFWLLILVAFTFGFIRYSTENETYIIPLFLSLLGSYFLVKQKYFEGYFFLSLAVLFHQIHIFWLIAFFVPQKNENFQWKCLLGSLIFILTFYIGYAFIHGKNWYSLPFNDVHEGLVETTPGIMNFIMTPISFARTFFQIHGEIIPALTIAKTKWVSLLFIVILLVLCLLKIRSILTYLVIIFKKLTIKNIDFRNSFFLAFLLHLLFAFYSVGNAEFMVMLPFLIILWQYHFLSHLSLKGIHYVGVVLCLWNYAFYVIPHSFVDFNKLSLKMKEIEFIQKYYHLKPENGLIITENNILLGNFLEYNRLIKKSNINIELIKPADLNSQKNTHKYSWFITDEFNDEGYFDRKKLVQKDRDFSTTLKGMNFIKVSNSYYLYPCKSPI